MFSSPPLRGESLEWLFSESRTFEQAAYKTFNESPTIKSYDLAPDGQQLAVLVGGLRVDDPLWVAIDSAATGKRVAERRLESYDGSLGAGVFGPQVLFVGGRVVVNDFRSVQVLDRETLRTVATFDPPKDSGLFPLWVVGARASDVVLCAFGSRPRSKDDARSTPVTVQVGNVRTGVVSGTFSAADVPQALAPDGRLLAVSAGQSRGDVLPVAVLTSDGKRVGETTADFESDVRGTSKSDFARLVAIFIAPKALILNRPGGSALQVAELGDSSIILRSRTSPYHFEPTGEMAVSADGHTLLVISQHWDAPSSANHHGPVYSLPMQAVIFENMSNTLQLRATIPLSDYGMNSSVRRDDRRPRLSADGTVFAIAQNNAVTVFHRDR